MLKRARAVRDPVTLTLDGDPVEAERGEPLAVALLAADKTTLARSPKLHRPRGPSCLRGACDGCLARVDGEPNVLTCLRPARGGERIETQNVIGSRKADLLRLTDWFFADGIDHHHLMAGVPGLEDVMMTFARKVAGLGKLPTEVASPKAARREAFDVLVVGAGAAGIAAASSAAAHDPSLRVLLADDGVSLGGSWVAAPEARARLVDRHPLTGVEVSLQSTVMGVFPDKGRDVLIATPSGILLATAKVLIVASGAHDGVFALPGNDLPGVFSVRALCQLLARGVEPTGPIARIGDEGGFWAKELERRAPKVPLHTLSPSEVKAMKGSSSVHAIERQKGSKLAVSVVAIDAPPAPSFELGAQAGAKTRWDGRGGYVLDADEHGRAGEMLFVAGECRGSAPDPDALAGEGAKVANAAIAAIRARA